MLRLVVFVVVLMAVLSGVIPDLGSAQSKYEPRLEGVSEWEIAEWQAFYGRGGPFAPGMLVPMYVGPAAPPPWVGQVPPKRGRPVPCKQPLW
jgi:hypothetical protein